MTIQIFIPSVVSEKNMKNSLVRYILEKQFPLTLSCSRIDIGINGFFRLLQNYRIFRKLICVLFVFMYVSLKIFSNLSKTFRYFKETMVFCYQNCSDLLWEKIVLVIEKNFWNSRLKAENFQNFWDH